MRPRRVREGVGNGRDGEAVWRDDGDGHREGEGRDTKAGDEIRRRGTRYEDEGRGRQATT
jgi:hypothetical protein